MTAIQSTTESEFRKFNFKNLTETDLKLLLILLKKVKSSNSLTITINEDVMLSLCPKGQSKENRTTFVRKMLWNLCKQVLVSKKNEKDIRILPFFSAAEVKQDTQEVVFEINDKFANFFKSLNINTNLDLDELNMFKSKYSIVIYRKLKSIEHEGQFVVSDIDQFKLKLGIENQPNSFLVSKILSVVKKEITDKLLKDFKITLVKKGNGGKTNKLQEIIFSWTPAEKSSEEML